MKIKVEVEFEIDSSWCADSPDKEERDWFWDMVMPDAHLMLWSNEVGDEISNSDKFTYTILSQEKASPIEPCRGHQVDLEDMIKDIEKNG